MAARGEGGGAGAPALHTTFGVAAASASLAEMVTLPLDTAKVRLQLQSRAEADSHAVRYRGPLHAMRTMVAEEGPRSLWGGLTPGLHRQFLFTGIRLGLYERAKQSSEGDLALGERIVLAVATSAAGIVAANPSDVLKVRFQAHSLKGSALSMYAKVASTEGLFKGLYKGFGANLARNSIISATEIISYETSKSFFLDNLPMRDDWRTHLAAGCTAGFAATVLGSPADVLGTKAMQKHGRYAGLTATQIARKMLRNEGVLSFYKGFWPNFCRIGSFNIAMWVFFEEIKSRFAF